MAATLLVRRALVWALAGLPFLAYGAANTPNPGLKYYYPATNAPVVDVEADLVIYGGTSGGVVAAVQAVRMGKSVALVVFGRHVGGMTAGGLTHTDGVSSSVQGGITREYFNKTGNSGFKPSKAELEFENLLTDPVPGATWDPPVPTYYEQRLASVEKVGARLVALHMENGSVFRGRMFLDCTYEGDLLARAGVSYTYGRESSTQYGESLAGKRSPTSLTGVSAYNEPGNAASGLIYNLLDEPAGTVGTADSHLMAYNFRMYTVQSANPASYQPLFVPAAYNTNDFEILYRFHRSGGNTIMTVGNDVNNHQMFAGLVSTDHIDGNRWPDGAGGWIAWPEADYPTRELMYQSHVAWQLGMLWYLRTDPRYAAITNDLAVNATIRTNVQSLITKLTQLGLALGEYPETGGWPHELYVREARRMVSDYVVTQAHYSRTIVVEDAIGQANYLADSHHVRRIVGSAGSAAIEGGTSGSTAPTWRIPYRVIIPKRAECENLLVPWAISASRVAFCSARMEPCFMVLSQSAATAAALALDRHEAVQDLPYATLRLHLLADGQLLGTDPVSTNATGIIVDNTDLTGFATTGVWVASSATAGYYGGNYLHDNSASSGCTATFTPNLPATGQYQVFARWTSNANRATNASFAVVHATGTNNFLLNQTANGGTWNLVGTFNFNTGTNGSASLRNNGASGYVVADAVQFVSSSNQPPAGVGVHVIAGSPVADEADGTPGKFQFVRDTESVAAAVTVYFSTGGTALADTHYQALPASVTIAAGARSATVYVTPIANDRAEGTRTVVVTITPDAGYAIGTQDSATVSIFDKPFDDWRHRHFGPTRQHLPASAPDADPDGDGRVNRLEFVLGTNPLAASPEHDPALRFEAGQAVFEYWQRGQARDLRPTAKFTPSLAPADWQALPTAPVTVSYDVVSGDRLWRHTLSITNRTQAFFRLELP